MRTFLWPIGAVSAFGFFAGLLVAPGSVIISILLKPRFQDIESGIVFMAELAVATGVASFGFVIFWGRRSLALMKLAGTINFGAAMAFFFTAMLMTAVTWWLGVCGGDWLRHIKFTAL